MIRISAGTLSPTATSTMSPGTSSLALIRWIWPGRFCRTTFAISGSYSFSASMALSAFRSYSCGSDWIEEEEMMREE